MCDGTVGIFVGGLMDDPSRLCESIGKISDKLKLRGCRILLENLRNGSEKILLGGTASVQWKCSGMVLGKWPENFRIKMSFSWKFKKVSEQACMSGKSVNYQECSSPHNF